jgi:hypothetical protein
MREEGRAWQMENRLNKQRVDKSKTKAMNELMKNKNLKD